MNVTDSDHLFWKVRKLLLDYGCSVSPPWTFADGSLSFHVTIKKQEVCKQCSGTGTTK